MTRLRRYLLGLVGLTGLAGYIYVYVSGRAAAPIRSDAFSYYVYLPSWALYHDPTLRSVADRCCEGEFPEWTAIVQPPFARGWVNPHPIGEAILLVPFFAAAHVLTRFTPFDANGFTPIYQHAAGLGGLVYAVVGLWFLRRWLARHFPSGPVDAAVVALVFGTSLFHYATFDSLWSHAFSFAACAALMERIDAWSEKPDVGSTIVVGVLAGLAILLRHTNAMIPVAFVTAAACARPNCRPFIAPAAAVAAVVTFPQLWIYHRVTRHWLASPYGSMGFTWATPHLLGVLVSPQKGVFFWSPLLLAAAAGFVWLPPTFRAWRIAAIAVLIVDTYLMASWWDWQFGASYGHRGFVDVYPLFAAGLAAAFTRAALMPRTRRVAVAIVTVLCALSTFQMLQYWHGVMPMSDVTWAQYRAAFLRGW